MQTAVEDLISGLTDYQFRLLSVLCSKSGGKPSFLTSVEELGSATNKTSDRTVRSALQALESKGLITRTKTKRANGFQGKDLYTVNYRTTEDLHTENYRTVGTENYRTSHDYMASSNGSHPAIKPLVPNSHNNQSSYKLNTLRNENVPRKEMKIPMKNYDDDEGLAGVGLIEPRDAVQPKIRKSDPRTRGKRPEHEWTAMDVAAEFSYQVGRKYPLLPGTVSVKTLSGALRKFRTQYGTTPIVELELLRLFMADSNNFRDIGSEAPLLYKKFLSSFGKKMNLARSNLGLANINAKENTESKTVVLTSSDGKTFPNSLSGRAQLERHEKRLGGKV